MLSYNRFRVNLAYLIEPVLIDLITTHLGHIIASLHQAVQAKVCCLDSLHNIRRQNSAKMNVQKMLFMRGAGVAGLYFIEDNKYMIALLAYLSVVGTELSNIPRPRGFFPRCA